MIERSDVNDGGLPDTADYALWIERVLRIALDGGPNVVSARAQAAKHGHLDDADSRAAAVIGDVNRRMFTANELNGIAEILDPGATLNASQRLGLARWVVFARTATAIALVYERDPEQYWVKGGILWSVDTTPFEEQWRQDRRDEAEAVLDWLRRVLVDPSLRKRIAERIVKSVPKVPRAGWVGAALLALGLMTKLAPSLIAQSRDASRCREIGERARRCFRSLGLPSSTERA